MGPRPHPGEGQEEQLHSPAVLETTGGGTLAMLAGLQYRL